MFRYIYYICVTTVVLVWSVRVILVKVSEQKEKTASANYEFVANKLRRCTLLKVLKQLTTTLSSLTHSQTWNTK